MLSQQRLVFTDRFHYSYCRKIPILIKFNTYIFLYLRSTNIFTSRSMNDVILTEQLIFKTPRKSILYFTKRYLKFQFIIVILKDMDVRKQDGLSKSNVLWDDP